MLGNYSFNFIQLMLPETACFCHTGIFFPYDARGQRELNAPSHYDVVLSERTDDFESLFLEHRDRSPIVGVSAPANDGIRFDETASLFSYGCERGFQRNTRDPALAIFFRNDKASYSPQRVRVALKAESSIQRIVINARQFLLGTVLAPSHWLALRVDEYSMRASALD